MSQAKYQRLIFVCTWALMCVCLCCQSTSRSVEIMTIVIFFSHDDDDADWYMWPYCNPLQVMISFHCTAVIIRLLLHFAKTTNTFSLSSLSPSLLEFVPEIQNIKPLAVSVSFSSYCAHSWQCHDGRLEVLQKILLSRTITQLSPLKRCRHGKQFSSEQLVNIFEICTVCLLVHLFVVWAALSCIDAVVMFKCDCCYKWHCGIGLSENLKSGRCGWIKTNQR